MNSFLPFVAILATAGEPDESALAQGVLDAARSARAERRLSEVEPFLDAVRARWPEKFPVRLACVQATRELPDSGSEVEGRFVRTAGRGPFSCRARDRVRLLRELESLMPFVASANRLRRNWYWRQMKELLWEVPEGGRAARLFELTDLSKDPPLARPVYEIRAVPVDANALPRFPALPPSWDAARTDGERWRWALYQWRQVDAERARRADLAIAAYVDETFGVHRLPHDILGSVDFASFADDEACFFFDGEVRRFRLPPDYDRMRLLASARAWEPLGDAHLLRGRGARALECYRCIPSPSAALRRKMEQLSLPLVRIDSALSATTARPCAFSVTYRQATNVICRLKRCDASVEDLCWNAQLPPAPPFCDAQTTLSAPAGCDAGEYLLTLETPGGNTACMRLCVCEISEVTVSGCSPENEVFSVDAETGAPVGELTQRAPSMVGCSAGLPPPERTFVAMERARVCPDERVSGVVWRFRPRTSELVAGQPIELTLVNPQGDIVASSVVETDDFGGAPFSLRLGENAVSGDYGVFADGEPAASGYVRVLASGEMMPAKGPEWCAPKSRAEDWDWLYGREPSPATNAILSMSADRTSYDPGETALLSIRTSRPDAYVFCNVRTGDRNGPVKIVQARDGFAQIPVEIAATDVPNVPVAAWTVQGGRLGTSEVNLRVPPRHRIGRAEFDIAASTRSNDAVTATIRLFAPDGSPLIAPVFVSFCDALASRPVEGDQERSLKRAFWGWTRRMSFSAVASSERALQPVVCDDGTNLLDLTRLALYGASAYDAAPAAEFLVKTPVAPPDCALEQSRASSFAFSRYFTVGEAKSPGVYSIAVRLPDEPALWILRVWAVGEGGVVAEATQSISRDEFFFKNPLAR